MRQRMAINVITVRTVDQSNQYGWRGANIAAIAFIGAYEYEQRSERHRGEAGGPEWVPESNFSSTWIPAPRGLRRNDEKGGDYL
jgi:hypothetical protein